MKDITKCIGNNKIDFGKEKLKSKIFNKNLSKIIFENIDYIKYAK